MISWEYSFVALGDEGGTTSSSAGSSDELLLPGYATLSLDPLTGDLPDQPTILIGPEAVIQKLRVRFRFFKGEWFLDKRQGIPYKDSILVKNPDLILISFIFRQVVASTPGVSKVTEFAAALDKATRELIVTFEAILTSGTILTVAQEPFILG